MTKCFSVWPCLFDPHSSSSFALLIYSYQQPPCPQSSLPSSDRTPSAAHSSIPTVLNGHLTIPLAKNFQRLGRVQPVPHITPLDRLHLYDRLQHRRSQVCVGGQADGDYASAGPHVFRGLLERLLGNDDEEDGMRACIIVGGGLDVLDEVLGGGEVDKVFCAELFYHFRFFVAGVKGDDAEAHCSRELAC